jgi:hypothetical protein
MVVLVAIILALFYYSDLIMPGVQVLGVELGGKSKAKAVALLKQEWQRRAVVLDGDVR